MSQFTGSNLSSRWVFRIWWWLDLLLKWFPNNSFKGTDIGIWIHLVFESLCGFPLPFSRTTFSKGSEIKVYTEFQMLSTIATILWCLNMSQDELLLEKSKRLWYMLVCIFFRAHSKTSIKITEKKKGAQKCKCGVWQVPKAQGSRHLSFLSRIQKFQEAKEKKLPSSTFPTSRTRPCMSNIMPIMKPWHKTNKQNYTSALLEQLQISLFVLFGVPNISKTQSWAIKSATNHIC